MLNLGKNRKNPENTMAASIEILRKSLVANGLPTSGTKAEMLTRLLNGTGDKRKLKGVSAKAPDDQADVTDDGDDEKFQAYKAIEKANLISAGITDQDAINEEITRRWVS